MTQTPASDLPTATPNPDAHDNVAATSKRLPWRRWLSGLTTPARRRVVATGAGVTLVIVVAFMILLSRDLTTPSDAESPPTNSELFAAAFARLRKPDETAAILDGLKIDDDMLARLTTLEQLDVINVNTESISPSTIKKLAAMPKLGQLHLRGVTIDDAMLRELENSESIWLLNIPTTDVSPAAIKSLDTMKLLRSLRIGIAGGDNRHGRAIATLQRLRTVHMIGIAVSDEGLQPLAHMPQLESLYLDDTAVTDAGWDWLFRESPHLHVHIDQKHHDRDPQKH